MPARIPIITPESDLNPEQRRVLAGLLDRRGGRIPGPYRFTLHCPEITELMHPCGADEPAVVARRHEHKDNSSSPPQKMAVRTRRKK